MREISLLQAHMIAFAAGFLLDLIWGDPHSLPHPVRWIGKLISMLERKLLPEVSDQDPFSLSRNRAAEKSAGGRLVVCVVAMTAIVTCAVVITSYRIHFMCGIVVEAIMTCYSLAAASLYRESMKVYHALKSGSLEAARQAVSMIVGRDTEVLDEEGVTKATVETVAENYSDGVFAPMFYAAIGGPVLGFVYKAINTMDSMIGYRNDRYMWFGAPASRLDDIANWIPSRISAFLLIAASAVSGEKYSAARAFQTWKRDRHHHKSPNAAQTESVMAGSLGVQLAGDAQYFGKTVHKQTIGEPFRPIEKEDIKRANHLMMTASVSGEALCLGIMWILSAAL